MARREVDLNNVNVGFVITGLVGMVEDDKLTPHEAFELLDSIKEVTWHALTDIKNGKG